MTATNLPADPGMVTPPGEGKTVKVKVPFFEEPHEVTEEEAGSLKRAGLVEDKAKGTAK
jgi:hypothetical protein